MRLQLGQGLRFSTCLECIDEFTVLLGLKLPSLLSCVDRPGTYLGGLADVTLVVLRCELLILDF